MCVHLQDSSPQGEGKSEKCLLTNGQTTSPSSLFRKRGKGEEEKGIPGIAEIFSLLLSYAADASNSGNPSFCFRVWEFLGPSAKIPSSLGSASVLLLSILEFCGGGFSTHYSFPPCDVSSFFPCCWHDRTPLRRRKGGRRGRGRNCGFSTLAKKGGGAKAGGRKMKAKRRKFAHSSGSSYFPAKSWKKN